MQISKQCQNSRRSTNSVTGGLGRVALTEYAQLKETLANCELSFKMADDKHVFPLTTRQFSATFLDFQRNSRGYNDKIESVDQDVTKRLLNPFLPDSIPQCHRFGKAMWAFAKECTVIQRQSTNQNTDLNLPTCHFNSEGDSKVTPSRVVEPPRSSELPLSGSSNKPTLTSCKIPSTGDLKTDFIGAAVWNEASKIKTTFNGTDQNQNTVISEHSISPNSDYHFPDCLRQQSSDSFEEICNEAHVNNILSTTGTISNRSSAHFENYIELANLEPGTILSADCHLKNVAEKRVDNGVESKHDGLFSDDEKCMKNEKNVKSEESSTHMPSVSDNENKDTTKGRHLCDIPTTEREKALKESLHKEHHILPLPLYKKGNYANMPISTSLTANLNLEALLSVLRSERKTVKYADHIDSSIYGKVAVLYGFQQNATVSVLQAEEVGLYDYISGTVNGLQQTFSHGDSESQVKNNTLKF